MTSPNHILRKWPISIVHYDAIPHNADAELSQAILPDRRRLPLDDYVINKIDFERFIAMLTTIEAGYIHLKMVDGMPDKAVSVRMDMSLARLREMKKALRGRIEDYFTV